MRAASPAPLLRWWAKYAWLVLLALYAVAAALFWAISAVAYLSYHEQYQLFLWTGDYLAERLSRPGGAADYLAEGIVQFFYLPVVGAILLAILLAASVWTTWALCQRVAKDTPLTWRGIALVPSLLLWCTLADPNVLLSLPVAVGGAQCLLLLVVGKESKRGLRLLATIVGIPLCYWLCGSAVYIAVVVLTVEAVRRRRWGESLLSLLSLAAILTVVALVVPYPLARILTGPHYYRYPTVVPIMQRVVLAAAAGIPYLVALLPRWRSNIAGGVVAVALFLVASIWLWRAFDTSTHRLIHCDYLVRTEQWDAILTLAEKYDESKKDIPSPMEVAAVNLALAQKGQLLDNLFHYYQHGGDGLFPPFARDILSPLPTAEIFFRLGFVNDCERYCYEVWQCIPDFQRSGRVMKRLTQCEIANGNYAVARRYLAFLEQTTFYRRWARETRALLTAEEKVAAHPLYRRLRACREQRGDYLFSEQEMDQMVGLLLLNNRHNRMAYEYLVAYEVLAKDLPHFTQYYPLGQEIGYKRLPTVVQEVLIGQWLQEKGTLRGIPYTVERPVVESTVTFLTTYTTTPSAPALGLPPLCYNTWHYLLMR